MIPFVDLSDCFAIEVLKEGISTILNATTTAWTEFK